MNWFEGEIAQAIVTSKAKQAIFVVYVYGKDEKSSQITGLINQAEVAEILGGNSFVAIKIESDSVSYQQFCQIYKQVPVPSIYFIGKQGVPLEIVTEANDIKSFQDQLKTILQKGGLSPVSAQTQDFISSEQAATSTPEPPPKNVVCENDVCVIKKNDQPSTSQENKSEASPEKTEEQQELSVEEKVERAKQLVEKKREEKRKEEMEKERQEEIERRKVGQSVQQLKRWQDDQELKQVLEEREKEKRESQAARERVLAQIAQDKAERAAKFSPPAPQQQPAPTPQASRPVNTNVSRLQFRMPDGRTSTNDFSSSDTLITVHNYIKSNLNLPFTTYTLSTTFPRREFTDNEKDQTLLELGLVPTAVILILPVNRGTVIPNSTGGFTQLLWTVLSPIFTILGYLKTFIFGSGPAPNPDAGGSQNKRTADSSNESRPQTKIRRAGETTVVRRQGNIHRLSNKNDSDDENNTWNGNSTQQM